MKNINFLLVLLITLSLGSCDMDLTDDFSGKDPVVNMEEVYMISNDSAVVVGNISSDGGAEIEVSGFCYDTASNPDIMSNQISFGKNSGKFGTYITGLTEGTTYYFKAFAANKFALSESSPYAFTVPVSGPPTIPCSLTPKKIVDNGQSYNVNIVYSGAPYGGLGDWGLATTCPTLSGTCTYKIQFARIPKNGEYTISSIKFNNHESKGVIMQLSYSSSHYSVHEGGKIFVEELGGGKYNISFCDLTYTAFSTNITLKGNIPCN